MNGMENKTDFLVCFLTGVIYLLYEIEYQANISFIGGETDEDISLTRGGVRRETKLAARRLW